MSNSYVQVPPDGAGKKIFTKQQVISGTTMQIQGISIVSGDNPENSLTIDNRGSIYTRFFEGNPIIGAYGDLKVLSENVLGVYEHTIDSYDDLFTIEQISGGTSEFIIDESSVHLSTTTESGSRCSRTTNRYHYYQPGVSFLITIAVSCGDTGKTNNIRQWGLFSDEYGYFFELYETTINVVLRSNITGTIIDNKISQSNWNIDKLDGTGLSGIIFDVSKAYQYFININYPSNIVSFGIYDGEKGRIICHKIYLSGLSPLPEIKHATLPIRFNNENIGTTVSNSLLREIMAVVLTEGNPDYTFWRFGDLGVDHRAVTTNIPIFSVRPKILLDTGKHNHVNSFPEYVSIYTTGSTIKVSMIQHDGTILSGDTWLLESVGGPLEADGTATYIDMNSDMVYNFKTFYVQKDVPLNLNLSDIFELNDEGVLLGYDNTQFVTSFVATSFGGVADVSINLSYRSLY